MKLKIKAKETVKALSFKDYVIDSATQQINRLKDDIDTFKKMYNKDMSPRETAYLDEAIAEKKKELSNQQALIKKYQKIRSSLTIKSASAGATISGVTLIDSDFFNSKNLFMISVYNDDEDDFTGAIITDSDKKSDGVVFTKSGTSSADSLAKSQRALGKILTNNITNAEKEIKAWFSKNGFKMHK